MSRSCGAGAALGVKETGRVKVAVVPGSMRGIAGGSRRETPGGGVA